MLTTIEQSQKMTSLEIAKVTEKQHKNVLQDIDKMLKDLNIDGAGILAEYKDASGKLNRMYNLDKELTLTLIAGYSTPLRNAIIKRWQELEQPAKPLTQSQILLMSAQALVELENKVDQTIQDIESIKGKVHAIESKGITVANDYYTVSGYCNLKGYKHSGTECNLLGRKCAKRSTELDYDIGKAHSASYGSVNTYHIDILSEIVS